ncbi:unnamed protein product [Rhizoctonia solani]|uniref:Vegetative incompatibility protein HET-E-1 [Podospora anserina] n=1 Tax=Rhizoctonia solani TaxID=456999 RepID=A0A8H2XCF2_9AGAM|nr:unnamed protein product [Rhizoctonia solani]
MHVSFQEFLFDAARSRKYYRHKMQHNEFLATRCFTVMQKSLRFNICNIQTSLLLDRDVFNLSGQVTKEISLALLHACLYWSEYLAKAGSSNSLINYLINFLEKQLLFWMEVLNLNKRIQQGYLALLRALEWLHTLPTGTAAESYKFLQDAHDFVKAYNNSPASGSTPHIYISALPFAPKESCIYRSYWPQMQGLFVIREPKRGYRYSRYDITLLALSPDGIQAVTGSKQGEICVWDIHDGSLLLGPIDHRSHRSRFEESITLVVFSPDDGTIRCWDLQDPNLITNDNHYGLGSQVLDPYDWRKSDVGSEDNKWILVADSNSGLVLYVPNEDMRISLPLCSRIIGCNGPVIEVPQDTMFGERWHKCYIGSANSKDV